MKLSIITINLNNASGLQKTIESVVNQRSEDFEYLIVDGGSTDASLDVIRQHQHKISSWTSEKDGGIYHAMNKGIGMASGEYVQFLNSGDWLVNEHVVSDMLAGLGDCDICVGNVISVRQDGKVFYNRNLKDVSLLTFYRSTLQHSSAYIKRSLLLKYGMYDESLKIVSDWKFYLIAAGLHPAKVLFSDIYVSYFDTTGISHTNLQLEKQERRSVMEHLIPPPVLADYDKYHFAISQFERMKRYPWVYRMFWFVERCLFKMEKYRIRYLGWRSR